MYKYYEYEHVGQWHLVDELADHSSPGAVVQLRAVLPVAHQMDSVLEVEFARERLEQLHAKALIARVARQLAPVLTQHHKRLVLHIEDYAIVLRENWSGGEFECSPCVQCSSCVLYTGICMRPDQFGDYAEACPPHRGHEVVVERRRRLLPRDAVLRVPLGHLQWPQPAEPFI